MDQERINFLLTEADRHLVGIQAMIPLLREIKNELQEMKNQMFANHEIHRLNSKIDKLLNPQQDEYKEQYKDIQKLLAGDWPRAIDPDLICNLESEVDKEYRAESIVEFVITDYLKDMNFLDFGCGEGHVVAAAAKAGATAAVGYDLFDQGWDRYDQNDNFKFYEASGSIAQLHQHAPYDVILLFDVLDHMDVSDMAPDELLKTLSGVLKPSGKIYIHCHPWCSRHGTHLYLTGFNKAFAHLVVDDVELVRMGGHANKPTMKLLDPVGSYREWFEKANLRIVSEDIHEEKVDEFFYQNQMVWNKLYGHWGEDPTEFLKISSVDYVLTPNTSTVF